MIFFLECIMRIRTLREIYLFFCKFHIFQESSFFKNGPRTYHSRRSDLGRNSSLSEGCPTTKQRRVGTTYLMEWGKNGKQAPTNLSLSLSHNAHCKAVKERPRVLLEILLVCVSDGYKVSSSVNDMYVNYILRRKKSKENANAGYFIII